MTISPAFLARITLQSKLRGALEKRGYLEVCTHVLQPAPGSDPRIEPMRVHYTPLMETRVPPGELYLHTSPEFEMKRLLCQGLDAIYQICPVMRQGELSPLHNPEFIMAEWYRKGWTWIELMAEVEQVAAEIAGGKVFRHGREIAISPPLPRVSVREAMREAGADPAEFNGLPGDAFADLFDDVFVSHIEPWLAGEGALFLTDFPAPLAVLGKLRDDDPTSAERFELIIAGVEIANGCTELTDAAEHRRRFQQDLDRRRQLRVHVPPLPQAFLADLESPGLPPCAGVALGLERLAMLASGADRIDDVNGIPFGS